MHTDANFCVFAGRPAFPAQTEDYPSSVRPFFWPGRTFAQYTAHVTKASILPGHHTDWLSPSVRFVSRGLKNSHDLPHRFQNFMSESDLFRLLKAASLTAEFGQAAFSSFLFLLRVPTGALHLRLASDEDDISDFPPKKFKEVVGVRAIDGAPPLLAKFPWRGNIRSGFILRRPCLCDEKGELSQTLCPIHMIWPRIIAGQPRHGLLPPPLTRSNFNRPLNRNMIPTGFPGAGRYSPHCFRRVATQEMQSTGSPDRWIKAAGCWAAMRFRSYIDTQLLGELKIARLLVPSLTNSDGEAGGGDPPSDFPRGHSAEVTTDLPRR